MTAISAFRTRLIFRCFERCDLGTKNCASATLFRHTTADPDVGFNIFMFQSANRAMAGNAEASELSLLDTLFKDLRDTG